MLKITRHKEGFYSTIVENNELLAFSMHDIVIDLFNIYSIDLRKYLFNFNNHLN